MLGNDFVLRGVLEGKVHSVIGPNITIGRDTGSRIVLADGSTSLAHAEITILDGEAILRDAGSDAGTFYGQKDEEGVRRLGKDESVALGEGDRVGFGQGESELYRVEQTPDRKRSEAEVSPSRQLQAGSTTDTAAEHDEGASPNECGEDDEGRASSHREDAQSLAGSASESRSGNEGSFGVVVTVARAEGLPGVTSSSVFRRPKKSQTHRRYVRVSIVDKNEGRDQGFSAVTSSVTGGGSTCRWGEKGSSGEKVSLRVDGGAFGCRAAESAAALELEVWSDQSESGAEDVLLCRGQTDMGGVGHSQSRWVVLDPKGKIEISVTPSPPEGDGAEQLDGRDREPVLERDGRTLPLGTDHAQEGGANTEDPSEEISLENLPEPRSPKWGIPSMPGLKNTLSVSLGRAANLGAKQREETPVNGKNGESAGTASQAEGAGQRADEVEDERQSISGDERERQVTSGKTLPDEHVAQGKQANRGAMRGMQSIKESLQTRLLGASSGKPRAGREDTHNEDEGSELQDEGAHDLPSASRESFSSARRSSSPSNVPMKPDEHGAWEAKTIRENTQKRMSRDKTGSRSSIDGGGHAERRRSGYQSPLRSLLQDTTAEDQDAHKSEQGKEDENEESGGDYAVRTDTGGDEHTSESHAKGPVAQVVSALDAASSVKAAASRFKSTLSSPSLASTLKGFGWNRPTKEEVVEGVPSSPSASSCDPVDGISSTTPTGANKASESATQLGGSSDPPLTVLVAVFRASGLPDMLAKNMFGRTKKNSTQDPLVRLNLCGVSASTSSVQGGGCACRWGKKKEGDIVEISIPSSNVPDAGLGASTLVVEVWNKANDELEKDILLGRTEILVADWLGEKAKWAALDAKRSQGGRVKLGVALKNSDRASSILPNGDVSEDAAVDSGSASDTKPDEEDLDEEDLISSHPAMTSTSTADVGDALQQTEEPPQESVPETNGSGTVAQQDGAASETAKLGSCQGSKVGVPPLVLSPFSGEDQQQSSLLVEKSTPAAPPVVERNLEEQEGSSAEATKGERGEEIDANRPVLQQNVPSTGQSDDLEIVGAHVDEQQLSAASPDKPNNSPHISSEVLEGQGPEGDHEDETEVNGNGQDIPSKTGGEPIEEDACIDLPSPAASDGLSTGSLNKIPKQQEGSSSGADIGATSLQPDESHTFERQQSKVMGLLTPHVDGGDVEGNADESAMAEGAEDARAVKNDKNVDNSSEVTDTPGASDALTRRVVGGTATALDLTAAAFTSDQRSAENIAEEQPTEASTVISASPSKENTELETQLSSRQGSNAALCQTAPIARKKSDSNGRSHGQDQEQPGELRGSSDLHTGGASGGGSRDGLEGLEKNGHREVSSEVMAKAPDTQPREQAKTREVDAHRIERAREIVRRHRAAVSSWGHAFPGRQITSDAAIVTTTEKAQAATIIQGAFRGRIARRRLRQRQRVVVRIQAAYRGHVERKAFVALRVRAKRAKAEEKRGRARRSRIAFITQELDLLRNTPAQQLLRVDALRAEACASRIQRFWRLVRRPEGVSRRCEGGARDKAPMTSCMENRKQSLTAPEISSRSNRIPLSGMTLEALRLRVATRQRAKERFHEDCGREAVLTREHLSDTERKQQTNGTVDTTYKTLLQCQEKASQLTAKLHHSETERLAAAKRRRERLNNFRKTQDQLLHPPKLNRSGDANLSPEPFENATCEGSRRRHILDIVTDKSWNLAEEPAQRDRAQRAHALAVAAAKGRGKKSWATSLPPDVGYDELVDIRTVHVPSWPTTSSGRGGRPDLVDGLFRSRPKPSGQADSRASGREFDSDEASLWWYTYATEGAHTTGLPPGDRVFAELLERAKTTPRRRKENAEREEQQHQLRVAQRRQMIIDRVIHRQQVASCPDLSRVRRRVTAAQRRAAVTIQAHIRGFLERKATAVLRAEMRVFGALQVLVNELRQPELEEGDTTNSLAVLLADRINGQGESRVGVHRNGRRSPTSPVPTSRALAVSSIG